LTAAEILLLSSALAAALGQLPGGYLGRQ